MMGATSEFSEGDVRCTGTLSRLVIVADNSLIVEAIRIGFRKCGQFNLVGRADGRRTSARTLLDAQPDVILIDDMDQSDRAVELLRDIRANDQDVALIMLSVQLDIDWLERAFSAGATGVMSKATHPVALATLVRETLNGHVFHLHSAMRASAQPPSSTQPVEDLPLTPRELEILRLVASGATNGDVALGLWVTEQTVKFHLRNIYRKLGIANRTQASRFAYLNGLVDPPVASGVQDPAMTIAS